MKKWYRGEKTIFEWPVGFAFLIERESRMVRYFKTFLETRIYNQVSKQLNLNATVIREREAKLRNGEKFRDLIPFKAVRVEDSIQTIFMLLGICLASCICLAILEYAKYNGALLSKRRKLILSRK